MNAVPAITLSVRLLMGEALSRLNHFRIELLIFLAAFTALNAAFQWAYQAALPGGMWIDIETAAIAKEAESRILPLAAIAFANAYGLSILLVAWLRVLLLGANEAFAGGVLRLAARAARFFWRGLLIGAIAALFLTTLASLFGIFLRFGGGLGQTTPSVGSVILVALIALTIASVAALRLSYAVLTTAFDGGEGLVEGLRGSWRLMKGATQPAFFAIVLLCLPVMMATILVLNLLIDPAALTPGAGGFVPSAAMVAVASIGHGLAWAILSAVLSEVFARLRPPPPGHSLAR